MLASFAHQLFHCVPARLGWNFEADEALAWFKRLVIELKSIPTNITLDEYMHSRVNNLMKEILPNLKFLSLESTSITIDTTPVKKI